MTDVDALVVGAGVIGLAVARALALTGRSVVVLEAADRIGSETSSRNSEVIHAGLYYPTGSLKARLCVAGRHALYDYCAAHGVTHKKCGKLVVAADESEMPGLRALADKGAANGVDDLKLISAEEAGALEPAVACVGAILSPSTGIFDSAAYFLALRGDAEAAGASFALKTPFVSARIDDDGVEVEAGGAEPMRLKTGLLVNCAGLSASRVAQAIAGLDPSHIPETRYAKGNYFTLPGRAPFSRLIYPMPTPHGVGLHLTFDVGGQARFGPDVEWVETIDYAVDPARAELFGAAIRRYWPGAKGALTPSYCGIRPKIAGPDQPSADFRIDGPNIHGVPGLINLFGIESPGLTSSLAIAAHVVALLR
ncbi:L-2-hydroxyglutarate oxidase LhgO [Rhodoblastus acidophilus]|uniref:L-2-hydroxyglutarate oxidase LhgO n=1 Tax=Rhodoblastus acidophilus TaxID=1074 RepID=A0A212R4E0_RHOAC|nr:NAD(P)/FAD-dependent oxidoreductase [Rhodoblastus acidophilus]PPQ36531.1 FAD-dependent oxidoreductase [Rhodoblastus acidophilus]RAI16938.1 FAD-dependent oxidoreductase [Rhodoblastus acidophilus]SNB66890.1 L-2-hydroxyglutarate oxidase LhgO [Rhodoblastus acidophilus]